MAELLATAYPPTLGSGRALRTHGIIRALAGSGGIEVVYATFGGTPPAPAALGGGVRLHPVTPSRGPGRAAWFARARLAGTPADFARGVSGELVQGVREVQVRRPVSRVIADGPEAAAALVLAAREPDVVYAAHNLESAFRHTLGSAAAGSRRRLERFERALIGRAAETWLPSERELELARDLVPGARLRLVPNVIDTDAITPRRAARSEPQLLFVADFGYAPNRQALELLEAEVMPRVWAREPRTRLRLVGRGLDGYVPADPRTRIDGFVDDLADAYAGAWAALVPLLSGGGSPLKFIEAMAYGVPVVATPLAARGLAARAGVHFRAGDGPAGLAEAILETLSRDSSAMVAEARRLVVERYSIGALSRLLGDR